MDQHLNGHKDSTRPDTQAVCSGKFFHELTMTQNSKVAVDELFVSPSLAKQKVTDPRSVNIAVVKNNGIDAVVLSASGFSFRQRRRKEKREKKQDKIKNKGTANNGCSTTKAKTTTTANSVTP